MWLLVYNVHVCIYRKKSREGSTGWEGRLLEIRQKSTWDSKEEASVLGKDDGREVVGDRQSGEGEQQQRVVPNVLMMSNALKVSLKNKNTKIV